MGYYVDNSETMSNLGSSATRPTQLCNWDLAVAYLRTTKNPE
ncbi:hypothetical protein [Acetobacterium malicum]|nr:hypothetical protein [Acetobacterium dehalogenans]